jgi:hypothetical protein
MVGFSFIIDLSASREAYLTWQNYAKIADSKL